VEDGNEMGVKDGDGMGVVGGIGEGGKVFFFEQGHGHHHNPTEKEDQRDGRNERGKEKTLTNRSE